MQDFDPSTLATNFLNAVSDIVFFLDREGRVVWWNEQTKTVTGYEEAELDGMDGSELVPPEQRRGVLDAIDWVDAFPHSYTMEFDLRTKDGRHIPYEFNGSVVDLEDRTVIAVIARDVNVRREREREIRRQRDELETLNNISETVSDVIQAVVDAATRAEIAAAVCEGLAESELYRSVWMGNAADDGTVTPSAAVGRSENFEAAISSINELDWERPAKVALRTGEVQVVQRIPESDLPEEVKETTETLGISAGIAVPIVHRGTVDGVLCVYSSRPDAFSERERPAFERLGEVVGFAINAVRTERLLLSDSATELSFRFDGPDAFLASVSERADGPCRVLWSTPVDSGENGCRHYVTVDGLDPESVLEVADEKSTSRSVEHLGEHADGHLFSVRSTDSLTRRLLDMGASPTSTVARDGETTVVIELPTDAEVRAIAEAVGERYDAELVSKREVERPVKTTDEFHDAVAGRLTDRQITALRHAYFGGYFSWPREATAEEVAERMNVSSPTFHYHVRHGQEALLEAFIQHLDRRKDD